jgi:hypothetical protein
VDVGEYWDKTDDELYERLGSSLLGTPTAGISPDEQDRSRRYGKQWFGRQQSELKRRICNDKRVRELTGNTVSDRIVDAAAIADLLGQHNDYAMHAALIAVLVARIGLGTFCANLKTGS